MILLDTHVLVWTVEDDPRLGVESRKLINAESAKGRILVAAISVWEIAMLVARNRLALGQDVGIWIERVLALPGIELAELAAPISLGAVNLPGTFHAIPPTG